VGFVVLYVKNRKNHKKRKKKRCKITNASRWPSFFPSSWRAFWTGFVFFPTFGAFFLLVAGLFLFPPFFSPCAAFKARFSRLFFSRARTFSAISLLFRGNFEDFGSFLTGIGSFLTGIGSFLTGIGSFLTGIGSFLTGIGSFLTGNGSFLTGSLLTGFRRSFLTVFPTGIRSFLTENGPFVAKKGSFLAGIDGIAIATPVTGSMTVRDFADFGILERKFDRKGTKKTSFFCFFFVVFFGFFFCFFFFRAEWLLNNNRHFLKNLLNLISFSFGFFFPRHGFFF
jgi:hypothetical protein